MENNIDNNSVPDIWGAGVIISELTLEEVAAIISEKVFGGLPFGGKDRHIYEEVPAVFLKSPMLGLTIILSRGKLGSYILKIEPYGSFSRYLYKNEIPEVRIRFDTYLYHLLKQSLNGVPGIEVVHAYS